MMEIINKYPTNWLAKTRITVLDDKVVYEFSNLRSRCRIEYPYEELSPKILKGRRGERGWGNIGIIFLVIGIILWFFFKTIDKFQILRLMILVVSLLLLIIFGLMTFIKKDSVCFFEKNGTLAFEVILDKNDPKKEEAVNYILEKWGKGRLPSAFEETDGWDI